MNSRQQNRQQFAGYIFAIGATAIWSANFIIARGDFSRLLNLIFAIGGFWMLLTSIIFAVYSMLLIVPGILPANYDRKKIK